MNRLALFVVLMLSGLGQTVIADEQVNAALRVELEAMFVTDQVHRGDARTIAAKFGRDSPEHRALWEAQRVADDTNIKRLTEIVDSHGWPEQSKVGKKAAIAAFLVAQHAGHEHQKRFLPLLREAVARGEALPQNLALLEDRILVRDGRPQVYGSQIFVEQTTGKQSFYLIEDETNVDQRRASVGLGPLAEYAKRFGFVYPPQGQ